MQAFSHLTPDKKDERSIFDSLQLKCLDSNHRQLAIGWCDGTLAGDEPAQ